MTKQSFKDFFRYVDSYFIPRVFVNTSASAEEQQHRNIAQSDLFGFQVLWAKETHQFNVLTSLNLRGNFNGSLTIYVFEYNGKLRDVEAIENIKTNGNATIILKDFNMDLNDKDIVMFEIEGEGGLSKVNSTTVKKVNVNNLILINKSIPKTRFKNPKIGKNFEVEDSGNRVEAVLELARKEEGRTRKRVDLTIEVDKEEPIVKKKKIKKRSKKP